MWTCGNCGCKNIAASLVSCPMCFEEREMPRSVAGAQPSNENAAPGEAGYIEPEETAQNAPEGLQEAPEGVKADADTLTASDSAQGPSAGVEKQPVRKAGK